MIKIVGKTSIKALLRKHKNAMTKDQRRHQAIQVIYTTIYHCKLFNKQKFNENRIFCCNLRFVKIKEMK